MSVATIDFGIDLGTTNSSVGVCRRGEVRIFQTTDLMNVTPSVVYVSKTGRMLVGKKAYDTWVADPQNTQAEFKRWMGLSDRLAFPASGKQLSAEELSAEILKSLRADAERQTQERVTAAVITVPAAFGALQCDATARAARLAGFEQAPLLQEPIAAAIAYGAAPASRDQRWMVFDLGGGTLDIAIVSTRNGRLAVLEHQGNNRLGGKDIDRLIAETFFLRPLAAAFNLPDREQDPAARHRLMRALVRHAEQTKIALSTAPVAVAEIFDVGDDRDGKPIEISVTLGRADLETAVAPVIDQCLDLARRALEGARLSGADLDRVLLVGGPTQMPVLRAALAAALGAKLDYSIDPMTVVAHGAALYASTLERTGAPSAAAAAAAPKAAAGAIPIQLAHERASGTPRSPVAGVIDPAHGVHEVKVDAAGGYWTSGWLPVVDGTFQVDVLLHDARTVTRYALTARGRNGDPIPVDPAAFEIAYMLPMGPPPLPHTIAIELSTTDGVMTFDPVFRRHSPLPAEARKTYRADRTLRPSEVEASLPIKFWEIDVSDDPQERWWAGCVHVRAERIKRPIPEGADLELTVRIDASRKMTVELFVPALNQSFADDVYIPDPPAARSKLQQELDLCFERLDRVRREIYEADREDVIPEFEPLQARAEQIAEHAAAAHRRGPDDDPDASLGPIAALRKLRMQITSLEERMNVGASTPDLARKLRWQVRYIERVVDAHGTESEKREFEKLRDQYERYCASGNIRGLKWIDDQIWMIHGAVVHNQVWYWQNVLGILSAPGRRFLNRERAAALIQEAADANTRGDLPALRSACNRAWALQPPDQLAAANEQAAETGLRGT